MTDQATEEVAPASSENGTSLEQIRANRIEAFTPNEENEAQEEVQDETPESEEVEAEESTAEEGTDVLSEIDWESLPDDTKVEIGKRLGSRASKRIGELTSKVKQIEQERDEYKSTVDKSLGQIVKPEGEFSGVTEPSQLDEKEEQISSEVEFFVDWLSGGEEYYEVDNKSFDRKQVSEHLKRQQARLRDIPKQRSYLRRLETAMKEAKKYEVELEDYKWLTDEDSAQYKTYGELTGDSDFGLIESIAPAYAAKLKASIAKIVDSATSKTKTKKLTLPKKAKSNPVPIIGGGAASNSPTQEDSKEIKALQERSNKGDVEAARKLRQLQYSKHKF